MSDGILSAVRALDSDEFEQFTAALWELHGWKTWITPENGDGGADVIARQRSPVRLDVFIEAKRNAETNLVSVKPVRELRGVVGEHPANVGVVVTSGWLTNPAEATVEDSSVLTAIEGDELEEVVENLGVENVLGYLQDGHDWEDIDFRQFRHGKKVSTIPSTFPRRADKLSVDSGLPTGQPETGDEDGDGRVDDELQYLTGVGDAVSSELHSAGISTLEDLADVTPESVASETELSHDKVTLLRNRAASKQRAVTLLPDVGEARAEQLEEADITSVRDLLTADPRAVSQQSALGAEAVERLAETARTWRGEPVEAITGIGEEFFDRLATIGVEVVPELAARDSESVAEQIDLSESRVRPWIAEAAFRVGDTATVRTLLDPSLRSDGVETVDGIGSKRAAALGDAGVETVVDLAVADPATIAEQSSISDQLATQFGRAARFRADEME